MNELNPLVAIITAIHGRDDTSFQDFDLDNGQLLGACPKNTQFAICSSISSISYPARSCFLGGEGGGGGVHCMWDKLFCLKIPSLANIEVKVTYIGFINCTIIPNGYADHVSPWSMGGGGRVTCLPQQNKSLHTCAN